MTDNLDMILTVVTFTTMNAAMGTEQYVRLLYTGCDRKSQ